MEYKCAKEAKVKIVQRIQARKTTKKKTQQKTKDKQTKIVHVCYYEFIARQKDQAGPVMLQYFIIRN